MRLGKVLVGAAAALACLPASAMAQVAINPGVVHQLPQIAVPVTSPAVVSLGDSAISGEAGRWAGNTNGAASRTDATGADTYYDNANRTAEAIPGCHRSESAEVHIGGVDSQNLACSGARTYTHFGDDGAFKPGLDFYSDSSGREGQALALQHYAADHRVKAVVVLIGANDYGFSDIVQSCVVDWLTSPSWWKNYCQDDSNLVSMFSAANIATQTTRVKNAYLNVHTAMQNAGYSDSQYRIIAQTYSSPIPNGSGFRYGETGFTRQTTGGCGVWNSDANWANGTVVATLNGATRNAVIQSGWLTNVDVLEMRNALAGRRLCENTVGLLEEKGVANWQSAGAISKSEWVQQIRTLTTLFPPYQMQEDGHPNYWGQLALRNQAPRREPRAEDRVPEAAAEREVALHDEVVPHRPGDRVRRLRAARGRARARAAEHRPGRALDRRRDARGPRQPRLRPQVPRRQWVGVAMTAGGLLLLMVTLPKAADPTTRSPSRRFSPSRAACSRWARCSSSSRSSARRSATTRGARRGRGHAVRRLGRRGEGAHAGRGGRAARPRREPVAAHRDHRLRPRLPRLRARLPAGRRGAGHRLHVDGGERHVHPRRDPVFGDALAGGLMLAAQLAAFALVAAAALLTPAGHGRVAATAAA